MEPPIKIRPSGNFIGKGLKCCDEEDRGFGVFDISPLRSCCIECHGSAAAFGNGRQLFESLDSIGPDTSTSNPEPKRHFQGI